jgi:hypothetical protein
VKVSQVPADGAGVAGAADAGAAVVTVGDGVAAGVDVGTLGDGVVVRAADAVGAVTAAVDASTGVWTADPMFPATATPPATAATARATTAAAHGQRRRAPASLDGSSE